LCEKPNQDTDVANYILYRGDKSFVILNSYPYNVGHVMVAPYRHVGSLEELYYRNQEDTALVVGLT
ncbi:MAG: HIT family hydrolase, partial [bacterium]